MKKSKTDLSAELLKGLTTPMPLTLPMGAVFPLLNNNHLATTSEGCVVDLSVKKSQPSSAMSSPTASASSRESSPRTVESPKLPLLIPGLELTGSSTAASSQATAATAVAAALFSLERLKQQYPDLGKKKPDQGGGPKAGNKQKGI